MMKLRDDILVPNGGPFWIPMKICSKKAPTFKVAQLLNRGRCGTYYRRSLYRWHSFFTYSELCLICVEPVWKLMGSSWNEGEVPFCFFQISIKIKGMISLNHLFLIWTRSKTPSETATAKNIRSHALKLFFAYMKDGPECEKIVLFARDRSCLVHFKIYHCTSEDLS